MAAFDSNLPKCKGCEFALERLELKRANCKCGTCGTIWYYVPQAAGMRPLGKRGANDA